MESLVKGDVVVVPFPFSDLSEHKRRPALITAILKDENLILCQITSKYHIDNYCIPLSDSDFKNGNIRITSLIKPQKLFTADKSIVKYKIGRLKSEKIREVENEIISIFQT